MERDSDELLKLVKENNKMLKKMRRNAFWGGIFKLIWIAVLIGVPVYVYLAFVAPVWENFSSSAQETRSQLEEVQDALRSGNFQELVELFQQNQAANQ